MFENRMFNKNLFLGVLFLALFASCSPLSWRQGDKFDLESILEVENLVPVVIIGSGPAGLAAGVYTARAGIYTVLVEGSKPGGLLTETTLVENWPGETQILGPTLMTNFKKQAQGLGVQFLTDVVTQVDFKQWPYKIQTADGLNLHALSVIVSTGASPRRLGVTGESEYWSHGVSACAVCDAPYFKNKNVIVVGGGDSAAEQALQLAPHARSVTLLVRKDRLRASHSMQQKIAALSNVKILFNSQIKQIFGDGSKVTGVELLNDQTKLVEVMPIDGVFLAIGHDPATKIFQNQLAMDEQGYINLDGRSQKTNVSGVFAAGEVSDHVYRQAGVAAGEGIKAALDAVNFLQSISFNSDVADKLESNYFRRVVGQSVVQKIKTLAEFDQFRQSDLPMVLDFYTDYCSSCIHMLPFYESAAQELSDKMSFLKVNADEAEELVRYLQVTRVPCFMVYRHGKLQARTLKIMSKKEMIDFFSQYAD